MASQVHIPVDANGFPVGWTAETQSDSSIRTTYDDVKAWYTKTQPEPNEIPGVRGPNTFENSVKFALGLIVRGTQGYLGDFPMSYVFPNLDNLEDYQRLVDDMDVAGRIGQMIQIQYFLMRTKYDDNFFLNKSHRPKLLEFFTRFRWAFSSEDMDEDFSILREREGDEIAEALNAMIDVLKNSTDEDPRLPETAEKFITPPPTRNTKLTRGMNIMKKFIEDLFIPDTEYPGRGHWKINACQYLYNGEPITAT